MRTAILQRARELGFDDCRFTSANPPRSSAHFERWLTEGRHGEMGYLQRTAPKRVSPALVLSQARGIVTLAVSYARFAPLPSDLGRVDASGNNHSQVPTPAERSGTGVVARYARFADYHRVLGERLERLSQFLNELGGPGTASLGYVDTGPFLERDLAQRAGLGFVGKHTNLIHRKLGNWIFLAEIITTLELPPDSPERNHCGSCTRCLTACPTQAIVAPFQLDARRCISYLTIELKGPIPLELRPAIGNRIFGCDDCLAVCPWNRFAQEGRLMRDHLRPELDAPQLVELLGLDDESFKSRFQSTPLLRSKRRGLMRNVCVALGNVGDKSALPALRRAANDPEPLIAEHAIWAIGQIAQRQGE